MLLLEDGGIWNNYNTSGPRVLGLPLIFELRWKLKYLAEAFQPAEDRTSYNSFKWLKDFGKQVDKSKEFLAKQLRSCNVNVEDSEPIYLWINSNGNNLQEHVSRTPGLLHFFSLWRSVS